MRLILLITLMTVGGSLKAQQARLAVKIDKLKSDKGSVHVTLRDSSQKIIAEKDVSIKDSTAQATFDSLVHGKYGVRVFHDENGNGKMDRTVLGIPTEGWGVSTPLNRGRGPVRFRNTLFDLKEDKEMTISIRN